jgi:hypothetical protein
LAALQARQGASVIEHLPRAGPAVRIDDDHRDLRLDACRGLALWFIFFDHIPGSPLAWLTLRNYGFSDTTEVFVFVSGYTCMLAYGGSLQEQGWPTIVARTLRRAWEIYAAFLLLLVFYIVLIWVAGEGPYLDQTNTAIFFQKPGAALLHAALLQYTPVNTDILPTFMLLHLAFPVVLFVMLRAGTIALLVSFLLYLAVQMFRWHLPGWPTGELYFNPLAWQVLFVFGAWYAQEGAVRLKPIVRSRIALLLAMLYLAISLAIALSWQTRSLEGFIPAAISSLIYPIHKSYLAPLRVLHFLALALVISHLTRPNWRGLMKPAVKAMIRCGENSLEIYCLSVLLSFAASVILTGISGSFGMHAILGIAGIALMVGAATAMTWMNRLDRRGPKPF